MHNVMMLLPRVNVGHVIRFVLLLCSMWSSRLVNLLYVCFTHVFTHHWLVFRLLAILAIWYSLAFLDMRLYLHSYLDSLHYSYGIFHVPHCNSRFQCVQTFQEFCTYSTVYTAPPGVCQLCNWQPSHKSALYVYINLFKKEIGESSITVEHIMIIM